MNQFIEKAKQEALKGIMNNEGGPFGAIIINTQGTIISTGHNQVLKDNDPTAHAEIMAIRNACKKLNTHDLSNYILYTSCEPCPMCLSAIIWANINEIYYACTRQDAAKIGFRDDLIYEYLKGNKQNLITLKQINREQCIDIFEKYQKENKIIY